ncbi:MAG TPA: hypothetical protein V6D08_21445 [Candidatus Obscuribacterales bacterium]
MARRNYSVICPATDVQPVAAELIRRDMAILLWHNGKAFLVYATPDQAKKWNKDFPRWPCR